MAAVQLTCGIDGCGMSWSVAAPRQMKASMAQHRQEFHPHWQQPEPKPMNPYRLDYSSRARQF
jgi:hypothetical protein